jgi:hypothetical protein
MPKVVTVPSYSGRPTKKYGFPFIYFYALCYHCEGWPTFIFNKNMTVLWVEKEAFSRLADHAI